MNHKRLHLPMELITDSHSQEQKANQWLDFLMENCLTARQKQILVLYYYEKQTLREIADQLGITESTACRTKKSCLSAALSLCLSKFHPKGAFQP